MVAAAAGAWIMGAAPCVQTIAFACACSMCLLPLPLRCHSHSVQLQVCGNSIHAQVMLRHRVRHLMHPGDALLLQVYAAEAAALQEKHNIALQAAADGGDAEEDVVLGKKVKKKKGAAAMRVDVEDDGMHDTPGNKRMRPASGGWPL